MTSSDKVIILKDGTLTDDEKKWFNVGEYKSKKNFVDSITTTNPSEVASEIKHLLNIYNNIKKRLEDIIDFHVNFERIHPFQEGNGSGYLYYLIPEKVKFCTFSGINILTVYKNIWYT